MFTISAKLRTEVGRKNKALKLVGQIPAVVYGPGVKNANIQVNEKEFIKVFREAGESYLVELSIGEEKQKRPVLINDIQRDPVSDSITHVDFYQADLTEEVEVKVPLVFEGVAPAEKDLGGTLNKNILEIKVSVENLKTFEDHILVKDLVLPKGVVVLKNSDEVVVAVLPPQKIEEELAKEITGDVSTIEKVIKEKKEEDVIGEPTEKPEKTKAQ